ncbi:unnamed protein product [Prorocentrum cordatum]|uniref:60S ribosomal protein L35 n=1 Tax=Prorocentrum cordatum TaxID=2364126 RepID=A0ABN9U6K0_9DINO|nr:unnamed protein product [Polarella glacialis]
MIENVVLCEVAPEPAPQPAAPDAQKAAPPERQRAARHAPREVENADTVDDEVLPEEHHAAARDRNTSLIEEDILQEQATPSNRGNQLGGTVVEEIEYDDDFEEAGEEDHEEVYRPVITPGPSPDPDKNGRAATRPTSAAPAQSSPQPSSRGEEAGPSADDIKKAMESENERLARKSIEADGKSVMGAAGKPQKKGIMSEYQSTMPKFNLGSGSNSAALQRAKDLAKMGVLGRMVVETGELYMQRPQKDYALFLAGKSLKYCNLHTVGSQTGDDNMDMGINTDEILCDEQAYELRSKTSKELLKELDEMKSELAQLRVAKVAGGAASKLAKIKIVRKSIARILTVYNQKQKAEARKECKGKKYIPLDLRPKKTRALRRALKVEQKTAKTAKEKTRSSNFPMRRFVVTM